MKEIDPVEELHKIRRAICKEVGGTPAAYAQYYYEMSQARLAADKTARIAGNVRSKSKAKAASRKPGQRRKAVMA